MPFCSFAESYPMMGVTPVENLFIQSFLPQAPGDYVRVYLYGLMQCYYPVADMTLEKMAQALGMEPETVRAAYTYWERRGLVERLQDKPPAYRYIHPVSSMMNESDRMDEQIWVESEKGVGSAFELELPGGKVVAGSLKQNPGRHNVLNAAGVLGLINALGMDVDLAVRQLAEFAGVRRRFDLVGQESGITVVDDYAHHPTEIAATIRAASQLDFNRIHVLFQPHRYSRVGLFTQVLKDEFASAFDSAHTVTFMDVFSAGEAPVPGVNGKTFLNTVLEHPGRPDAAYVPRRMDVPGFMADIASAGDLVITMGAGDVTAMGPQLLDELRRRGAQQEQSLEEPASLQRVQRFPRD